MIKFKIPDSLETSSRALYADPGYSIYLSLWRVILCCILLIKLANSWPHLETLYGNSFIEWNSVSAIDPISHQWIANNPVYFHLVLLTLILLVLFGIGRNTSTLLLAIVVTIQQNASGWTLDGGDNLLKFQLFYLSFANAFHYLSFAPAPKKDYSVDNLVTRISVWCILGHLCLAYFISGVSKANSDLWYGGIATYYIFLGERFRGTDIQVSLVKNELFVLASTYGTLIWEIAFPFIVWYRRLKIYVLAIGLAMHVGIFTFMMIHEFQFIFMATYGFFYRDHHYRRLYSEVLNCFSWLRARVLAKGSTSVDQGSGPNL